MRPYENRRLLKADYPYSLDKADLVSEGGNAIRNKASKRNDRRRMKRADKAVTRRRLDQENQF